MDSAIIIGIIVFVVIVVILSGGFSSKGKKAYLQSWSQVRSGMSENEVQAILGEPKEIKPAEGIEGIVWSYGFCMGKITFIGGKVTYLKQPSEWWKQL